MNAATQPNPPAMEKIDRHLDHLYYVATQSIGLMHLLSLAATASASGPRDQLTDQQVEGILSISRQNGLDLRAALDAAESARSNEGN